MSSPISSRSNELLGRQINYAAGEMLPDQPVRVFGPPSDRDAATAVLREVVEAGITHIDTADFYGPRITNQIIRDALHPDERELHIVTKVGSVRDEKGN